MYNYTVRDVPTNERLGSRHACHVSRDVSCKSVLYTRRHSQQCQRFRVNGIFFSSILLRGGAHWHSHWQAPRMLVIQCFYSFSVGHVWTLLDAVARFSCPVLDVINPIQWPIQKFLKGMRAKDNASVSSSFVANTQQHVKSYLIACKYTQRIICLL